MRTGWNLHSAPGRRKRYPPKPNLWAFFLALGFSRLERDGRLCFLVPRTLLTEPDYDALRHALAREVVLEKLISFDARLFGGGGPSGRRAPVTSSLILVGRRGPGRWGRRS